MNIKDFENISTPEPSINISISDVKFSNSLNLRTTLGSCVAVILYADPIVSQKKDSSMSHFLLPYVIEGADDGKKPFKYGSKLIPYQITKMQELGIPKRHMLAKIAGGSTMFPNKEKTVLPDIGKQNILSAKKVLKKMNIRVVAENVGGNIGRNIEFSPNNQKLKVTIFGKPPIFI